MADNFNAARTLTRTVGSISSSQFLQNPAPQTNPAEACTRTRAPARN